jgi:hypothetical protein
VFNTRLYPLGGEHIPVLRSCLLRPAPQELVAIGDRVGVDGNALAKASRLVAKVDSAAVQDGFDLYLHGFIVTDDGNWTVVQQGMNGALMCLLEFAGRQTDTFMLCTTLSESGQLGK